MYTGKTRKKLIKKKICVILGLPANYAAIDT
jgi:hypothetical protein